MASENGNDGNEAPPPPPAAAARRRTHVRPRPLPQSAGAGNGNGNGMATEGNQCNAATGANGAGAGGGMDGSIPNASSSSSSSSSLSGAHPAHANHCRHGTAPPSPRAPTRRMLGHGNGYYGNTNGSSKKGGSTSASPRSRHLGADAHTCSTGSRNNKSKWKRFLFGSVATFVVVWMSIMTAMVAKLSGEDPSQQQQQPQPISDIPPSTNNVVVGIGNGKSEEEGGSIRRGRDGAIMDSSKSSRSIFGGSIFGGIASMWRRMRCGQTCWGRTYTYTDPISGRLTMAPLETIQMQVYLGGDTSASFADGHHPRGPIYYATPSMLPYPTQILSSPQRSDLQAQWHRQGTLDPMLRVNPGEEAAPQDHDKQPYVQGDCVPMKEWQVSSFPNCNAFHELNMMGMGRNGTDVAFRRGRTYGSHAHGPHMGVGSRRKGMMYHMEEDAVKLLGRGWFRAAWKVDFGLEESYPVVLKTLRLERDFYDEYYDLHRKDAVAMERLTPSPYVIDIYGFCGQSAINELADFFEDFTNLQAFARQLGGNNDEHLLRLKLQICIMMALGVAHMHEIDGPKNATMVHYDINPKNVAIVKGGKPKLNDFNTVEFLKWNRVKEKRCGFRGRLHEPWWRAPEELIMPKEYAEGKNLSSDAIVATFEEQPLLDEKIDVWSLGNLIYNMLTGHAARGQARAWRYAEVRHDVLAAKMPWRPTDVMYLNSTQPAIVAMKRAVERCLVKDPRKRWSALDVAYEMMDALDKILEENKQNGEGDGDGEGRANGKQGK